MQALGLCVLSVHSLYDAGDLNNSQPGYSVNQQDGLLRQVVVEYGGPYMQFWQESRTEFEAYMKTVSGVYMIRSI